MNLLLDTHLLIWLTAASSRLPPAARALIEDSDNDIAFSVASLWEIAIKRALKRPDFDLDPRAVRALLKSDGYRELDVTGDHAVLVDTLPLLHRDPFDRLLIAQAAAEHLELVTVDAKIAAYPGAIRRV